MQFNEPLRQPQGTVRAIITLALLVATLVMHYLGKSDPFIDGLTSLAVGFYIGQRAGETTQQPRGESELLMPTQATPEADQKIEYIPGE